MRAPALAAVLALPVLAGCVTSGQPVQFAAARPANVTLDGTFQLPEGAGPFPGVVLLHGGCNLDSETHVADYQRDLTRAGFATLAADSWRARGLRGPGCPPDASGGSGGGMRGPQVQPMQPPMSRPPGPAAADGRPMAGPAAPGGPMPQRPGMAPAVSAEQAAAFAERFLDAYGAVAWLRGQPKVDPQRIAVIGFSDGGRVALHVAAGLGPTGVAYPDAPLPRAAVGYYPSCFGPTGNAAATLATLEVPYLAHVAGNEDWPGPVLCPAVFERLVRAGAPLTQFDYPGAHHDFNARKFTSPVRTPQGTLLYNAEADRLAWERTLAFLREKLAVAPR